MTISVRRLFHPARTFAVLAALMTVLSAGEAGAKDAEGPLDTRHIARTRVRRLFNSAYSLVQDVSGTPSAWWFNGNARVYTGRTMVYRDMSGTMDMFSAEMQPLDGLSAELELGNGGSPGGEFSETSWIHAPDDILIMLNGERWVSPEHREYAEDRAALSGVSRVLAINLYYRVYRTRGGPREPDAGLTHTLDLAAGYSWYRDEMKIFHGEHALSTDVYLQTPPKGPYQRLASTSEMKWEGWRGGFRERAGISRALSVEGRMMLGPTMAYRGESRWNLRPDVPAWIETARGHLFEFSAVLSWAAWRNLEIECGYMGWMYRSVSGTRRLIYTDGTSSREELEDIRTKRKGWVLGLSWKF